MLTVVELSKIMDVNVRNLKQYINYGYNAEDFFFKTLVNNKEKGRGGHTIVKCRPMWCIDESKVDAFIEFWKKRSRGRKSASNGLYTQERLAWTDFARECYEARGRCSKCNNNRVCTRIELYDGERRMKKTVIELVKELGIPPERIM